VGILGRDALYRFGLPFGVEAIVLGVPRRSVSNYCIILPFAVRVPDSAKGARNLRLQVTSPRRHISDATLAGKQMLIDRSNADMEMETGRVEDISFTKYTIPLLRPGETYVLHMSFLFTEEELAGSEESEAALSVNPSVRLIVTAEGERPRRWTFSLFAVRSSRESEIIGRSLTGSVSYWLSRRWWRRPIAQSGHLAATLFPAWLREDLNPLFARVLLTQVDARAEKEGIAYDLEPIGRTYRNALLGPLINLK